MTKEEAIETIKDICLTTEQLTRVEKAFRCLLSKPSLPSELDEAAENYANAHYGEYVEVEYEFGDPIETIVDDKPFVRDAFKAGAGWMANQGVTKEAVIGMATAKIIINVSEQALDELDLCPSDKIVVQIRKK